jgi:MraZ protein
MDAIELLGTYHAKLDDKNRLAMPVSLRNSLGHHPVYFTLGKEHCLTVLPKPSFDIEKARINAMDVGTPEGRQARRDFFANAHVITPDGQGRFTLPPSHVAYLRLKEGRELTILGAGDYIEIWDPAEREALNHRNGEAA